MTEIPLRLDQAGLKTSPFSSEGLITPAEFFRRLPESDRPAIGSIVKALGMVRKLYQGDRRHIDPAEFAAYGWGGVVTKGEKTNDVDMAVITTDTRFATPYTPPLELNRSLRRELSGISGGDPVLGRLVEPLIKDYYLTDHESKVFEHAFGTDQKVVFRMAPATISEGKRAIDLTYIKGVPSAARFEGEIDVDDEGKPLPRVRLGAFRAAGHRENVICDFENS